MATYQNSEKTRLSLIEAAGELIAENGTAGVTTREIARKAGTVQNAITYHFGGINGLVEAVWAYVLIEWEPGSFERFLKERLKAKPTREDLRDLVSSCIRFLFQIMYRADRPLWISKFLVRSALSPEGREYVAHTVSGNIVPLLTELFRKISGKDDPDEAQCWSLRILAAPMVFTAGLTEFAKFRRGNAINKKLYRKLEEVTIREALFAVGLE